MANATYIQSGDSIDYTPPVNVPAGTIVRHGLWVGVAKQAIPANQRGILAITGVFDIPKLVGQMVTFEAGTDVFWSETLTAGHPSQFDPGDIFIGHAVEAATDLDPTVRVRLQYAPNSHSPD